MKQLHFIDPNSSASNWYRWTGDGFHLLAIFTILLKFLITRSSKGISGKTQILLALTYTLRYTDLWYGWRVISYYNITMKVFYIAVSFLIVYLIYSTFRNSYNWEEDSFRVELLILPVTILAFSVNYSTAFQEISWTWSIYMESVALIPQLFMIWKLGRSEMFVIAYLCCMSLYRGMYILNWIYRYNIDGYYDPISITGGLIETFVGLLGFLCVISLTLANISEPSIRSRCDDKSVYVIPLIPGDLDQKQKSKVKLSSSHLPV